MTNFSALMGLVGIVIGVLLTHFLARDRHGRDRIWDLKREAYSEILYNLGAATNAYDLVKEGLEELTPVQLFEKPEYKRYASNARSAIAEASLLCARNELILSDFFRRRFESLTTEIERLDYDQLDPIEEDLEIAEIVRKARDELQTIARKEILGRRWKNNIQV